jgi:hypothetical protein
MAVANARFRPVFIALTVAMRWTLNAINVSVQSAHLVSGENQRMLFST